MYFILLRANSDCLEILTLRQNGIKDQNYKIFCEQINNNEKSVLKSLEIFDNDV